VTDKTQVRANRGVAKHPCHAEFLSTLSADGPSVERHAGRSRVLIWLVLALMSLTGCQQLAMFRPADIRPVAASDTSAQSSLVANLGKLLPARTYPEPPDDPAALEALNEPVPLADQYRIGPADELEISVYNAVGLVKKQLVRPDGRIEFPLVGELKVADKTPEQVRLELVDALDEIITQPEVTVIVTAYKGRKFSVTGALREPGTFEAERNTRVVDALAMAGGLEQNADLRGSVLMREGQVLPVSLHRLLKETDLRNNIIMRPGDTLFVPDVTSRRALVLGEVRAPSVVVLDSDITVVEAITRAQGFARGARTHAVLVIRGSLDNPHVLSVDADAFLTADAPFDAGRVASNLVLQPGDIVYVSKTLWATFADFLRDLGVSNQLAYIVHQPSTGSRSTVGTVQ
jgi:polysaccharide biosynthesis/export protein